jgi:serine/threonine protein kinase
VPEAPPPRSVLASIADRTGLRSKILLPDSDSEHGSSPMVDPSTASKLVPQGRGNYQLLGEIARGGMGVILKGHDTDLGRDVAVKVLDGELAKRPNVVQRFVEEAQIGGQLQHPGIVPVYELGLMAGDVPYFTMKLVKGRTLAALLQQRKSPADDRGRLLAIFESVCQTMAYAHSKGVLHRDLKPANIMVGAFGEVQVVDWGLAKVMQRGGVADEKRAKHSTMNTVIETVRSGPGSSGSDSLVGSVMGTPAYMAPEQAQGEVDLLDERADAFSLGAILCEILTGKPPYVESEGETVLHQAGRAKLGPARERIEACGADPALRKLCLECLTPAREMRPANAAVLAKAMHEFLVSVEERARKAEIEATEARLKAAEERRARRLTLALAGAIVAAVALGGGGFYYANRERSKRAELTRNDVETAQGESIRLGQAGKHAEALQAALGALARAESGEADAALVEHSRKFVAQAELDLHAAEREQALAQQDEKLRTRLIDLRLRQLSTVGKPELEVALDAAFTQAFRDYGVDLEGGDVVPAMKRIRERKIALDVALSLDDWGQLRRRVHGAKSEKVENLMVLALDLDPDPLRLRLREAIASRDLPAMLELTRPEVVKQLEPGSIFVLCAALWDGFPDKRADVFRVFEQALQEHPGDFALRSLAGAFYQDGFRVEQALSCRVAALALRPSDVPSRFAVGESLLYLGRLPEAVAALRVALAADPTMPEANDALGIALLLLGDPAGALACLSRTPEIEKNPDMFPDLAVARFYNGALPREEIERLADAERTSPPRFGIYLWALVDHPDPKQCNPELALRLLREREAFFPTSRWPRLVEIVASVRLGDFAHAVEVFERSFKPPILPLATPITYDFLRALVYARVGRTDDARNWYRLGMVAWEDETAGHPEMWEHSDAMRWRREAEAALGK